MVSIHGRRELTLQVEERLLIKWTSNREIILDYPGEPKVTTGSLKVEKGRGRQSGRCDYVRRSVMDGSTQLAIAGFEDVERWPWAKECRRLPESGRRMEENAALAPSWLLPSETLFVDYYKKCVYECGSADIFLSYCFHFLLTHSQKWNCWSFGRSISNFLGDLHTVFPKWLDQLAISWTVYKSALFYTFMPAFVISGLFNDSHSNRCGLRAHCCFNLHFFIN